MIHAVRLGFGLYRLVQEEQNRKVSYEQMKFLKYIIFVNLKNCKFLLPTSTFKYIYIAQYVYKEYYTVSISQEIRNFLLLTRVVTVNEPSKRVFTCTSKCFKLMQNI